MPRIFSLVIPEGLIVIAAVALARFGTSLTGFTEVAEWLPALVFLTGIGLAWRFQRGRLFVGLLVLGLVWGWVALAQEPMWRLPLAVVLALVLGVVGWSREQGFRGIYVPTAGIAVVAVLGYALMTAGKSASSGLYGAIPYLEWTGLPGVAGIAFIVAALALLVASLLRGDGVAQGSLWAVVAGWVALVIGDRAGALVLVAGGGAAMIAGTLESIFSSAYRDALTGLPSRRALDERLDGLPEGAVVAMVDVDHFKQFNDTYGHDTGDQVLRMVAWRLSEVRDVQAFRYGGEEFTLVFSGLSLKEALARLDGARAGVAASRFTLRSGDRPKGRGGQEKRGVESSRHGLAVTISIGAAVRGSKELPAALLKRADEALYAAKEGGRDRIVASR
ncbi:MAG: GGDEF domain-containing protein [Gemmatimonadales bacterium]